MNSIGISNTGIYSRVVEGNDIQNVHTNINERLSFCRYVQGTILDHDKRLNRYIGTTNSRIIDYEKVSLDDYCNWTDRILEQLLTGNTNGYFSRFALPANMKENIKATSILIDFTGINDTDIVYKKHNNQVTGQVTGIESACIKCEGVNNEFKFSFNNEEIKGSIKKSGSGKEVRYRLNIPKFLMEYFVKNNNEKCSLECFLNRKQSFRIFFNNEGLIYSAGYFFRPNIKFKKTNLDKLEIGKRIFKLDGLDNCCQEKFGVETDAPTTLTMWPTDSVFGCFLDALLHNKAPFIHTNIDYLVCDDLQKEIADFIAIDELNHKLMLIHCKHNISAKSASAFQDLCGQAIKNSGYLVKNNIDLTNIESHIHLWRNNWKRTEGNVTINVKRIIKGNLKSNKFWSKYKEILKYSDVKTEVWLVMDGLSREELKKQLRKANPEEQISQLMWILYCTQEVIAEVGGTLKIFCKK